MATSSIRGKNIGIWGLTGSGKTTLLGALQWSEQGNWAFLPDGDDARSYLDNVVNRMNEGQFPLPTDPTTDPKIYDFIFSRPPSWWEKNIGAIGEQNFRISVLDAPGAYYTTLSDRWPLTGYDSIWAYLAECSGLLCLFDPENAKPQFKGIMDMLFEVRRVKQKADASVIRLDIPIAFVLSKMDGADHLPYFGKPYEYAYSLLGRVTIAAIANHCINYEFFSISSIGLKPDTRTSNMKLENGEAYIDDTHNMQPINVFAPIHWLFTQMR